MHCFLSCLFFWCFSAEQKLCSVYWFTSSWQKLIILWEISNLRLPTKNKEEYEGDSAKWVVLFLPFVPPLLCNPPIYNMAKTLTDTKYLTRKILCRIFYSFSNFPKWQNRTPTHWALSLIDRLQVMVCWRKDFLWNSNFWKMWFPAFWWL